jgi:hypothetical protein
LKNAQRVFFQGKESAEMSSSFVPPAKRQRVDKGEDVERTTALRGLEFTIRVLLDAKRVGAEFRDTLDSTDGGAHDSLGLPDLGRLLSSLLRKPEAKELLLDTLQRDVLPQRRRSRSVSSGSDDDDDQ